MEFEIKVVIILNNNKLDITNNLIITDISKSIDVPVQFKLTGAIHLLKATNKRKQSSQMVEAAISENPFSLQYASKRLKTYEICFKAVKSEGMTLKFVPKDLIDRNLCLAAVVSDGMAIEFVPVDYIDKEVAMEAVSSEPIGSAAYFFFTSVPLEMKRNIRKNERRVYPIKYIPDKIIDKDIVYASVKAQPLSLKNIPEEYRTKDICEVAISRNGIAIKYVPESYIDTVIVDKALDNTVMALEYIPEKYKNKQRCINAFNTDIKNFKDIPHKYLNIDMCKEVIDYIANFRIKNGYLDEKSLITKLLKNIPRKIISDKEFINYMIAVINEDVLKQIIEVNEQKNILEQFLPSATVDYIQKKQKVVYNTIIKLDASECDLPDSIYEVEPVSSIPQIYDFSDDRNNQRTIYYISDLHLEHQFHNTFPDEKDVKLSKLYEYVEQKVDEMIDGITDTCDSVLLIGGDVAHSFPIMYHFYEYLSEKWEGKIVSVLGNHELWNGHYDPEEVIVPPSVDFISDKYNRTVFDKFGIKMLQNTIFLLPGGLIDENTILKISEEELRYKLGTGLIILGGTGFSGLNPFYNAKRGLYRHTLQTVEDDITQTERFAAVYNKLSRCVGDRRVIVLTHCPYDNWTDKPLNENWIYVSGHTHRNGIIKQSNGAFVLHDNQIGYSPKEFKLKAFTTAEWDEPFLPYPDGIYKISKDSYLYFNRRIKGINITSFKSRDDILMLKKNELYMFLLRDEYNRISLLEGGKIHPLSHRDPQYYYIHMDEYYQKMKLFLKPVHEKLRAISEEVKRFGGSGFIHGSIVDITPFTHLYLNIEDSSIIPYFAINIVDKFPYSNVSTLLYDKAPTLLPDYNELQKSGKLQILNKVNCNFQYFPDTSVYNPSNKLRAIQYMFDNNVIRTWYDDLINSEALTSDSLDYIDI